jgi:deoxyribonuclease-4
MAKKASTPKGPLLGSHMSIAGGVDKAILQGQEVGCEAIQIFTKSSRQWVSKPLSEEEIARRIAEVGKEAGLDEHSYGALLAELSK